MKQEQKHTPTSWGMNIVPSASLDGTKSYAIEITNIEDKTAKIALLGKEKKDNAQFIVTACNAHEDLVNAASLALHVIRKYGNGNTQSVIDDLQLALAKTGVRV